jgi:Fe-S cluster assembly protein SufA/iron-sulfur cluster assembly protein
MEIKSYNPSESLVTFTESAYKYVADMASDKDALGVQLQLKPGGCSGFEFVWDYVYEYYDADPSMRVQKENDFVFVTDNLSVGMLTGSEIDLEDKGIAGSQLIVKSPMASGQCGCGESVAF